MAVDEQTVTYTYPGQWALLWLLRTQAATSSDFTSMKDTRPNTLRFEIPNGPEEKTIVYDRITLLKPAKGKKPGGPLTLPNFPVDAPGLDQAVLDMAEKPVIVQGTVKPDPEIMEDIDNREKNAKEAKKPKKKEEEETPDEPEEKPAAKGKG
jgi:type VI secretion system protein ImpL